jgi:hypothetical protein
MSTRHRHPLSRPTKLLSILGLAAIAATACRPAVRTLVDPSTSSLVVRNTSAFDINVYALPTDNGPPAWLATVPASGTRSLAVNKRQLQRDGGLVIRAQALGSTHSWTSGKIEVDEMSVAVLDLVADWVGDVSTSQLYSVARQTTLVAPDK